jgi:hypothetical protein
MDFKGPLKTQAGSGSALTILDDHSRFNLCLVLCPDQRGETVQTQLVRVFERYGLPERILADNGSPWGSAGQAPTASVTRLGAWIIRNGISLTHGRPYHPQTQGKEERFHRTLGLEVLASKPVWTDISELQEAFEVWRPVYNLKRPHEAAGHEPPVSRYQPSSRSYSPVLPRIEYRDGDEVRKVQSTGIVYFRGRELRMSKGLRGEPVALRASADGVWDVYYCHQRIGLIDLTLTPNV